MTTVVGIDGIGGNTTKEGPPYLRALEGARIARLRDVEYELALPLDRELPAKRPSIVRAIPATSLEDAIAYFSENNLPTVTAFNTQEGLPKSLRKRIAGIKRIPLAAELPRECGGTVLFLDVGGNSDMCTVKDIGPPPDPTDVGAVRHYFDKLVSIYMPGKQYEKNARDMVHFARLGSLYMEILRGVARPRVGLFNIGVEEGKGNRFIHICHELLQQEKRTAGLNYVGFAEPEAIEETDVIVIDGFTGNSVLKGIEKAVTLVKSTIKRSLVGKLVSCFSRTKTDPSDYSGAYLLGLRDIIVKIHGDAKAKGFATAYRKAREFAQPTRFNRQSYSNLSAAIEAAYAARYAEK